MAAQNRGLKRIVHRALEEMRATWKIARVTSVAGAVTTFLAKIDIQIMNRNGFRETPSIKKRLIKKHEVMLAYFEKQFSSFVKIYDFDRPLADCDPNLRNRIWMCWWQGLGNAPDTVKACIASVQRGAGDRTVTIITEENYKEYVIIPEWIERKYRDGIITRTNYSDLLRLSLLAQYGGIWLDATFFCTGKIIEEDLDVPIWSIKRPDYLHASVACGYFAGYSLGCKYSHRWVFATIRDMFLNYWKDNNMLIDYLLIDYMIVLAQRFDHRIEKVFSTICPNNPACDELFKVLGEPYVPEDWERMKEDTSLFKLSWKQTFPLKKEDKDTFYAKLIAGEL